MSPSSLFPNFVQKPSNGLLLCKSSTIEVFADRQGELVLAYSVLADDVMQSALPVNFIRSFLLILTVFLFGTDTIGGRRRITVQGFSRGSRSAGGGVGGAARRLGGAVRRFILAM